MHRLVGLPRLGDQIDDGLERLTFLVVGKRPKTPVLRAYLTLGLLSAALVWTLSCGCGRPGPIGTPPDPPQWVERTIGITVRDPDGTPLAPAVGSLTPDEAATTACQNHGGRLACPTTATGGATLEVEADGYVKATLNIALDPEQEDLYLRRKAPPLLRLRIDGRVLRTADGRPFVWQAMSAFRLVELVASGREIEADDFLARAAGTGVTLVRVFSMAGSCCNPQGQPYLFRLEPAHGRAALPRLLELAANHGLYVEVVALLDTKFYTFDHKQHVYEIGQTCLVWVNCVLELANEPMHGTQLSEIADPKYLATLNLVVPAEVPVAYGAAHGADDSNFTWSGGDYVPIHLDRADGEDEFTHDGKGFRWVRHIKDALDTAESLGKFTVNDEPRRDDLTPWKHTAVALICRVLGIGDTFHYGGGLHATWPDGAELAAFEGRRRGWQAIPADWQGRFYNVSHVGSMVPDADWSTVLKVFSAASGNDAYTVAIGSQAPRFTWAPDWLNRELVLREGGTSLYRVSR
jgi:hypothetical protein